MNILLSAFVIVLVYLPIHVEHYIYTVVPVVNGHPRDQAKVSVHDRWPLVRGTEGQAGGGAKCNTGYSLLVHENIMHHHQRYSY